MLKIPDSGLRSSQHRTQVPPGRALGGDPLNPTLLMDISDIRVSETPPEAWGRRHSPSRVSAPGTSPLGGRALPPAVAGPGLWSVALGQAETLNDLSPLFLSSCLPVSRENGKRPPPLPSSPRPRQPFLSEPERQWGPRLGPSRASSWLSSSFVLLPVASSGRCCALAAIQSVDTSPPARPSPALSLSPEAKGHRLQAVSSRGHCPPSRLPSSSPSSRFSSLLPFLLPSLFRSLPPSFHLLQHQLRRSTLLPRPLRTPPGAAGPGGRSRELRPAPAQVLPALVWWWFHFRAGSFLGSQLGTESGCTEVVEGPSGSEHRLPGDPQTGLLSPQSSAEGTAWSGWARGPATSWRDACTQVHTHTRAGAGTSTWYIHVHTRVRSQARAPGACT